MTLETCKKYFEIAKKKGNAADMEFWKKRAELHGGVIEEEVVEEKPKKEKVK